jgi:hypothetical protein
MQWRNVAYNYHAKKKTEENYTNYVKAVTRYKRLISGWIYSFMYICVSCLLKLTKPLQERSCVRFLSDFIHFHTTEGVVLCVTQHNSERPAEHTPTTQGARQYVANDTHKPTQGARQYVGT